jgi:hypothetical protein
LFQDFLDLAQTQSVLYNAGCTSITVLMVERELYVANVGDSRCVLSSRGKAINLSTDHKPDRQDEKRRIEALGGVVARTPEEADYLQSNFVQRRCMDLFYACCMPSSKPTYDGPSRIFPGTFCRVLLCRIHRCAELMIKSSYQVRLLCRAPLAILN